MPKEASTGEEVKKEYRRQRQWGPLVRATVWSTREDGSPIADPQQAYVTRSGRKYHTQWCAIMAAHWRDKPGSIYVTKLDDIGLRERCSECDSDPEMMKHFKFERAEWQRLTEEMNRLGVLIARTLVAKGPEGVNQVGPHVIRFREADAKRNALARRVAGVFPESYNAPNW